MATDLGLLTEKQAAERLNRTPGTLRNWRSRGVGPRFVANPDTGRFLGYLESHLVDWLQEGGSERETA